MTCGKRVLRNLGYGGFGQSGFNGKTVFLFSWFVGVLGFVVVCWFGSSCLSSSLRLRNTRRVNAGDSNAFNDEVLDFFR